MMDEMTTSSFLRNVEDVTFRGYRNQSAIDDEIEKPKEDNIVGSVPVSLTPEQVKRYFNEQIGITKDVNAKKMYQQVISWIDEAINSRKEIVSLQAKLSLFTEKKSYDNGIGEEKTKEE